MEKVLFKNNLFINNYTSYFDENFNIISIIWFNHILKILKCWIWTFHLKLVCLNFENKEMNIYE